MKHKIFYTILGCLIFLITFVDTSVLGMQPNETSDLYTESYAAFRQLDYYENVTRDPDRIQPHTGNMRYWQYKGEPVLLLGASDQDNLFNHPDIWPFGLESHLDLMVNNGGNYVRNVMSSRDHGNPWPFDKNEDGLYDLTTWNEEYWNRFERFLKWTHERDIIVQIEVWDRFDYARGPWNLNPYNPKNNINYTSEETRLPEVIETHPGQRENPFFRTPPEFEDNPLVLEFQRAHVDKLLSVSLSWPHVLYCISNETNESPKWSDYWAYFILKRAMEEDVLVHVTEMWDAWDLADPEHDATFEKPDMYTFVDVSQNTHQRGQTHWDNAQKVRNERLAEGKRPMNNVKIYGGPRHGHSIESGTRKLWRNIFGGFATSRFHRTTDPFNTAGIGLSPLAQTQIRSLRMFTNEMNVFSAEPANALLSERAENEAYAFAEPGKQYAVYFPDHGSVQLDLSAATGQLSVRWLDIMNSKWQDATLIEGGGTKILSPPDAGPWSVLLLAYPSYESRIDLKF